MNANAAVDLLQNVIRRKHFALSTEESYRGWLLRFTRYAGGNSAGHQK